MPEQRTPSVAGTTLGSASRESQGAAERDMVAIHERVIGQIDRPGPDQHDRAAPERDMLERPRERPERVERGPLVRVVAVLRLDPRDRRPRLEVPIGTLSRPWLPLELRHPYFHERRRQHQQRGAAQEREAGQHHTTTAIEPLSGSPRSSARAFCTASANTRKSSKFASSSRSAPACVASVTPTASSPTIAWKLIAGV